MGYLQTTYPAAQAPQNALGAANFASGSNSNVVGTPAVIYRINVPDGGGNGDVSVVVAQGIRVIDAWVVKTVGAGDAGNSWTLRTAAGGGGTAVTSAMNVITDTRITRTTTIDDAVHEFAPGSTMFLRRVRVAGADCIVYILAVRT